jgi:hypothetical protein
MNSSRGALRDTFVEATTQLRRKDNMIRCHTAKKGYLVENEVGQAAVAAQNTGMQYKRCDSSGRIVARVEFLREQNIGKLAVMVIPSRRIGLCACNRIGQMNQRALPTEMAHNLPLLGEVQTVMERMDSRLLCC